MRRVKILCFAALALTLLSRTAAHAQITPLADSYTNSADATTNYGTGVLLQVDGATIISYIQFPLTSIPSGATVSAATLKLYVNTVATAGSFNVDYVNGSWSESSLTYSTAPALGGTIASNVAITAADKNQYILINVTSAVQAWLSGSESNDGIALVADGKFNATFDSKENTTTSHPPELDIAYGDGTITGITTASGSGLTGGGTSGALNLSLTNACTSGQILRWNGSVWACSSAGMGTITGITAGTDLTGGGTTGKVTLNVDTTKVPLLAASNTFTGNQTVNGNLSATGVLAGSSYQIGSNLFAFGSYANLNAFLGFAGNTGANATSNFNTALGVQASLSNTTGNYNSAFGAQALQNNTTGSNNTAAGVLALYGNTTGAGNSAFGSGALFINTGSDNSALGFTALNSNTTGGANNAFGYQALTSNTVSCCTNAFGYQALYSESLDGDAFSDAFGFQALYSSASGFSNGAFGYQALYSDTTGYANDAFGVWALTSNTTGYQNAAFAFGALTTNTTGSQNTGIGYNAFIGNQTGSDLTCVGYSCNTSSDGLRNATAIGAHAVVGQSNSLVLGGTGDYAVNVGIGTTNPSNILTIGRGLGHPVSDSWETYSSRRWKTNIKTLPDALSKVEQLRGVSYDRKDSGKHEIGVIAEEVGQVVPEVVSYESNGKDAAGVDYSRLTALLIEAVKQQQTLIRKQQAQIRMQRSQMKAQQTQIAVLGSQVKTIQASLKANGGNSQTEIRTTSALAPTVHGTIMQK
jgi:hypothetical protein